ncbi:NAD-dependent epimerase/dehydratase family protein [Paenibacillus antri]|uniref:NAD-dependent epimerase/dehydratase family protein n=1 Tax=Paenibacillus antri TaxID=2582848 RepID=A0A5R9GGZ3_9BACL|nr:GDP-mannose 4,6-dehydratase [Paenibacillus antri]TLS52013.1 NAD-dependent epimerase/dehydratase family protein [Paenibacillus antri]
MKAFITGISGFVGYYLANKLVSEGYDVLGISRAEPKRKATGVEYILCDINDRGKMEKIITDSRPDHVYHLAGPAFIPLSYEKPNIAYGTIVDGTLNLYEIIRKHRLSCKVLYVGSADVYGHGDGTPLHEGSPIVPMNPYAGAKACAEIISKQFYHTYGIQIVSARPFNHTGPYQSVDFVCSNFAKQIALMEKNGESTLSVGNIEVERDFLDVRDVVDAYYLLMQCGTPGEVYNVCSGTCTSLKNIISWLFMNSSIQQHQIFVAPEKLRKVDAPVRVGNHDALVRDTRWFPKYKIKDTMHELLQYWRDNLEKLEK